jgi:hypothetical protein
MSTIHMAATLSTLALNRMHVVETVFTSWKGERQRADRCKNFLRSTGGSGHGQCYGPETRQFV